MFRILIIVMVFSSCLVSFCMAGDGDLQYRWNAGDDFGYQVTIEVDKPTEKVTYKGVIRYHVDQSSDQWSQITFRGGTREETRRKEVAQPKNPRDIVIRIPTFPDPFANRRFAGTSTTTNKITLSPYGAALAMEGDSQLPHLIGNLSLLPFEQLSDPEDGPKNGRAGSWKIKDDIAVQQSDRQSRHPFPSMFGRSEPMNVRTAKEETSFKLTQTDGHLRRFKKVYSLSAPPIGDKEAYSIRGEGTWVFDTERNLPHSLTFTQTLETKANNVLVRVPIKISYELLTVERIAEIDRVATERREKLARDSAERKRQQETPLTAAGKRQTLKALASGSDTEIIRALSKLTLKKLKDPDASIVSAIQKRLHDSNPSIARRAHHAMMAWSSRYSEEYKANQAYHERQAPVDSTDRKVSSTRQLYVGQIIQAKDRGSFWYAAEVIEVLSMDRVLVKMRGGARNEVALSIDKVQLAPDLVRQPEGRSRSVRSSQESRTGSGKETSVSSDADEVGQHWIDSTGKHEIDATFIELSDDSVRLKKANGKEIKVPLSRLSDRDQRRAKNLQEALQTGGAALSDNPFE